ncbi:hypothetical protein DFH28DRAFT_945691 [Melampsora americana]|nr:hypothetical protein DFH28DRAFT_945691 [Melampsora americana]
MTRSFNFMIWFISLDLLNFSYLVIGMEKLKPICEINEIPIDTNQNLGLHQPLKGINQEKKLKSSSNTHSSFRSYKESSSLGEIQANPMEKCQNTFHYPPQQYEQYFSPCINPSLKTPATPTPIKLSHSDAKAWADDLLSGLSPWKDPSQLQQGSKSSHALKLKDLTKEKLILPSIGTSSDKHTACHLYPSLEGKDQQGSKRQKLIHNDKGKISNTKEDKYHSEPMSNNQEEISRSIYHSDLINIKQYSQTKIFKPNIRTFRKIIQLEKLSLFDFHSDESNYQSSMSVISKVVELAEFFSQSKTFYFKPKISTIRESLDLSPIEDTLVHFFEDQFGYQQKTFEYIRSYAQWIGSDSNDVYKAPNGFPTVSHNWHQYSLSKLYQFGTYKIRSQEFVPLKTEFDDSDFEFVHAYDRFRWVRQVQSIHKIPSSRQKLCEAIMWGGYLLFREKRTLVNISRIIRRYTEAWRQINKTHEIGPLSATYVVKSMIDLAAMTEETWTDSNKLRIELNHLYNKRGQDDNGKVFWKSITPSMELKSQKILNWDEQDQAAKLLVEATNYPESFSSKILSWGFRSDQESFLWNLSMDMRNSQRQQQMIMDQMYEGMNLRLNMINLEDGKCEIRKEIHQKQFSNKIHLLSLIADHLLSEFFVNWKILRNS